MNKYLFINNNKIYLHELGTNMTTKKAINKIIGVNRRHEMLLNVFVQFNHRTFILKEFDNKELPLILPANTIQ